MITHTLTAGTQIEDIQAYVFKLTNNFHLLFHLDQVYVHHRSHIAQPAMFEFHQKTHCNIHKTAQLEEVTKRRKKSYFKQKIITILLNTFEDITGVKCFIVIINN